MDSTSGAPESFMGKSMAHLTRDGNQSKAESHRPHEGLGLAEKLNQIQNIFSEHKQLSLNEGGQIRPSVGKESSEVEHGQVQFQNRNFMPQAEVEDERPTTPIQMSNNAPTFNNEESQARP